MNAIESFSRDQVAVMAEPKRKDQPSPFEVLGAVLVLPHPIPLTCLYKYFLDLGIYPGIISYLLKLVLLLTDQKNLIATIKLTHIGGWNTDCSNSRKDNCLYSLPNGGDDCCPIRNYNL